MSDRRAFNGFLIEGTARDLRDLVAARVDADEEDVGLVAVIAEVVPADGGGEYRMTPGAVEFWAAQSPRLACGRDAAAVERVLEQILEGLLEQIRNDNDDEEVNGCG